MASKDPLLGPALRSIAGNLDDRASKRSPNSSQNSSQNSSGGGSGRWIRQSASKPSLKSNKSEGSSALSDPDDIASLMMFSGPAPAVPTSTNTGVGMGARSGSGGSDPALYRPGPIDSSTTTPQNPIINSNATATNFNLNTPDRVIKASGYTGNAMSTSSSGSSSTTTAFFSHASPAFPAPLSSPSLPSSSMSTNLRKRMDPNSSAEAAEFRSEGAMTPGPSATWEAVFSPPTRRSPKKSPSLFATLTGSNQWPFPNMLGGGSSNRPSTPPPPAPHPATTPPAFPFITSQSSGSATQQTPPSTISSPATQQTLLSGGSGSSITSLSGAAGGSAELVFSSAGIGGVQQQQQFSSSSSSPSLQRKIGVVGGRLKAREEENSSGDGNISSVKGSSGSGTTTSEANNSKTITYSNNNDSPDQPTRQSHNNNNYSRARGSSTSNPRPHSPNLDEVLLGEYFTRASTPASPSIGSGSTQATRRTSFLSRAQMPWSGGKGSTPPPSISSQQPGPSSSPVPSFASSNSFASNNNNNNKPRSGSSTMLRQPIQERSSSMAPLGVNRNRTDSNMTTSSTTSSPPIYPSQQSYAPPNIVTSTMSPLQVRSLRIPKSATMEAKKLMKRRTNSSPPSTPPGLQDGTGATSTSPPTDGYNMIPFRGVGVGGSSHSYYYNSATPGGGSTHPLTNTITSIATTTTEASEMSMYADALTSPERNNAGYGGGRSMNTSPTSPDSRHNSFSLYNGYNSYYGVGVGGMGGSNNGMRPRNSSTSQSIGSSSIRPASIRSGFSYRSRRSRLNIASIASFASLLSEDLNDDGGVGGGDDLVEGGVKEQQQGSAGRRRTRDPAGRRNRAHKRSILLDEHIAMLGAFLHEMYTEFGEEVEAEVSGEVAEGGGATAVSTGGPVVVVEGTENATAGGGDLREAPPANAPVTSNTTSTTDPSLQHQSSVQRKKTKKRTASLSLRPSSSVRRYSRSTSSSSMSASGDDQELSSSASATNHLHLDPATAAATTNPNPSSPRVASPAHSHNPSSSSAAAAAAREMMATHSDSEEEQEAEVDYLSSIFPDWMVGRLLGTGATGMVFEAIHPEPPNKPLFAIKKTRVVSSHPWLPMPKLFSTIVKCLRLADHPNILSFYGVEHVGEDMYVFMEFAGGGSVRDWIYRTGPLFGDGENGVLSGEMFNNSSIPQSIPTGSHNVSEPFGIRDEGLLRLWIKMTLEGLRYIHKHNIIHRDLKPGNLLLKDNVVKLADFGAAKIHQTCCDNPHMTQMMGSPSYMAPEIITSSPEGPRGGQDIWSLGCCLFEMVLGKPPWYQLDNVYALYFLMGTWASRAAGLQTEVGGGGGARRGGCEKHAMVYAEEALKLGGGGGLSGLGGFAGDMNAAGGMASANGKGGSGGQWGFGTYQGGGVWGRDFSARSPTPAATTSTKSKGKSMATDINSGISSNIPGNNIMPDLPEETEAEEEDDRVVRDSDITDSDFSDSDEGNGSSVDGNEAGGEDMENSDNGSRIDYGSAAEDDDGSASFEIADFNVNVSEAGDTIGELYGPGGGGGRKSFIGTGLRRSSRVSNTSRPSKKNDGEEEVFIGFGEIGMTTSEDEQNQRNAWDMDGEVSNYYLAHVGSDTSLNTRIGRVDNAMHSNSSRASSVISTPLTTITGDTTKVGITSPSEATLSEDQQQQQQYTQTSSSLSSSSPPMLSTPRQNIPQSTIDSMSMSMSTSRTDSHSLNTEEGSTATTTSGSSIISNPIISTILPSSTSTNDILSPTTPRGHQTPSPSLSKPTPHTHTTNPTPSHRSNANAKTRKHRRRHGQHGQSTRNSNLDPSSTGDQQHSHSHNHHHNRNRHISLTSMQALPPPVQMQSTPTPDSESDSVNEGEGGGGERSDNNRYKPTREEILASAGTLNCMLSPGDCLMRTKALSNPLMTIALESGLFSYEGLDFL
ncbi:Suppressor of Sensor Kinase (SLN1) [Blyttiomyces sp. JEL0837]|nr:Suppressor of Sensor Kinase (SLN1) [Blyttiomyces sp. JEL0837]